MKNVVLFLLFGLLLTSCMTTNTLYSWGKYQENIYGYAKEQTDKSLSELMTVYQTLIDKQTGSRKTVPPGICADYGYLLVQQGKKEEGLALLRKEIALYPESSVFISRIINNLEK